mgnify:CR=1 FL=1
MNNNLKPLSRKEMNELRKTLPKLEKRRKTIKDYINALKNYDRVVAELKYTKNKLDYANNDIETLQNLNILKDNKLNDIQNTYNNLRIANKNLKKDFELKCNELEQTIAKLEKTENRRRINASKIGGLVKQINTLNKKPETYKQIINAKNRDLKQAATIIKSLNYKIKVLEHRLNANEKEQIKDVKSSEMNKK